MPSFGPGDQTQLLDTLIPSVSDMYTITRGGTGTGGQQVAQSGPLNDPSNELLATTTPEAEEIHKFVYETAKRSGSTMAY